MRTPTAAARNAATRGLPTAVPHTQVFRDTKAPARGLSTRDGRGDGSVATNGGMPSDYQVRKGRGKGVGRKGEGRRGREGWGGKEGEREREREGGRDRE